MPLAVIGHESGLVYEKTMKVTVSEKNKSRKVSRERENRDKRYELRTFHMVTEYGNLKTA